MQLVRVQHIAGATVAAEVVDQNDVFFGAVRREDHAGVGIAPQVLGDDAQWTGSLAALASARGFIRNWLRQHLELRVTPELDFRPDRSMEHAAHIQALLRRVGGETGS